MQQITCLINGVEHTKTQIEKIERDLAEIEYANKICEIINDIIPTNQLTGRGPQGLQKFRACY